MIWGKNLVRAHKKDADLIKELKKYILKKI